jgi:hypothetical protein
MKTNRFGIPVGLVSHHVEAGPGGLGGFVEELVIQGAGMISPPFVHLIKAVLGKLDLGSGSVRKVRFLQAVSPGEFEYLVKCGLLFFGQIFALRSPAPPEDFCHLEEESLALRVELLPRAEGEWQSRPQ